MELRRGSATLSSESLMRSADLLCEEERIRRLDERITRKKDESSELAREKRARALARELRALGIAGAGLPPSMALASAGASLSSARAAHPSAGSIETALTEASVAPSLPGAGAREVVAAAAAAQQPWGVSTTSPPRRETVMAALDPKERLSNALDEITVKGIVDFRSLSDAPPEVEAVAIAALRLLGGQAREADKDAAAPLPPQSWVDVKCGLLKPGHFVNSLRKFPYAAERGQVPESDICDVEEVLAEVPPHGKGLEELHPMAWHLYVWVRAALEYAAWSHTRLEDVATPARAGALLPVQSASYSESRSVAPPHSISSAMVPRVGARTAADTPQPFASGAGFGVSWASASAGEEDHTRALFGGPPIASAYTSTRPSATAPDSMATLRQHSPGVAKVRGGGYDAVAERSQSSSLVPVSQKDLEPEEVEENLRQLEQAKKEVREIRALESQVKWEMEREEKFQVEFAKKEADDEIMLWREEQAVGMREIAEERERLQRKEDLVESKEFQSFKRESKQVVKEAELQVIKERYQADLEFSHMQADLAQIAVVDRHAIVLENIEGLQDIKAARTNEQLVEKASVKQERAQEQRLTYSHQANQLSKEKEELLQRLQLLRSRQKMPISSNRGLAAAGGPRR